ncbi:MAG: 4'-phosphopantetheinyl transferase superfamily protein [Oscillospiraceae bacterium]|nr:4'-phosphopantetheinyl transferase superfamily protein [Oscillospiraceae bacterium]
MEYRKIAPGTGHEEGRKLLAEMYRRHTGETLPQIRKGERGKPYFASSDWHFSISHTKNHVFCVLDKQPIGIDAEELDRDIKLTLAEKILSPMEKAQFDAAEDKKRALLTFWVLKEAAGKMTGEGINGYPNKTNFTLDDPRVTEIDGCLIAVIKEDDYDL